jgi:heat shock protein HslJ
MHVRKNLAILALIAGLILAGRVPSNPSSDASTSASQITLNGAGWLLEDLNNQLVVPNTHVTLNFEAGKLSGTDGCNLYNGSYTTDGEKITVHDKFAGTRRACEESIMKQASAYIAMLMRVATGRVNGRQLTLFDADGNALATFRRQNFILAGKDPKNSTYVIDGEPITLIDGVAEKVIGPGSDLNQITRYFGNSVDVDLDGDGAMDKAFLLVQESGGSGTFYFVVAALNTSDGYVGTNAILIGDRIAPQTTMVDPGSPLQFIVNYVGRRADEPMSAKPSRGVSKAFKLEGDVLIELASPTRTP